MAKKRSLELFKLLKPKVRKAAGEGLIPWAKAFEVWLAERRSGYSPSVGHEAYSTWREFLALSEKAPREVETADVDEYVGSLEARGLRPGTISRRLAALSKFYEFCQESQIDPACETGFNPVLAASRPQSDRYAKVNYLSGAEETALLEAIQADPSVLGKRDYAMFLALLRAGWKAGRVRELRCGDLEAGGKGEGLPEVVREAIREYLRAAGRLETVQPEDYVFAPSMQPLLQEAGSRAEDWDASRPLSVWHLSRLLKQHAGRAGLKAEEITCHTLRHTAARRQVQAGEEAEAVGTALGVRSVRHVQRYWKRLGKRGKPRLWAGRKAEVGVEPAGSRGPCRARRRNHLALTHGFYARNLPEFEWLAEQGVEMDLFDANILRMRVILRRLMVLTKDETRLDVAIRTLNIAGTTAIRIAKMLKLRKQLRRQILEEELIWRFGIVDEEERGLDG